MRTDGSIEHAHGHDISTGDHMTLAKKRPGQLSLFQNFCPGDAGDKYSNTIEFYDAIPKYFTNKRQLSELREGPEGREIYLPTLEYEFKHKGETYIVEINPARAENRQGKRVEYYPSEQEELVEEALKKIACDRLNGVYLEQGAGVQFSMFELREELRKQGHTISDTDLKRSLLICRETGIRVRKKAGDDDLILSSSIFPVVLISTRREWEKNPKNTHCYVQFNPLITYSINALTYRQFDYETLMGYKYQLSRWFHKRLSHNFIQADIFSEFGILMSTIIHDSRLVNYGRPSDAKRAIERSLHELIEKGTIYSFDIDERRGARNKIEDILYKLKPSMEFVSEMKKANKRAKENEKLVGVSK